MQNKWNWKVKREGKFSLSSQINKNFANFFFRLMVNIIVQYIFQKLSFKISLTFGTFNNNDGFAIIT